MRLTLVMPYYRNPRMLIRHLVVWRHEWSPETKQDVAVVIVDDGSPDERAADALAEMWDGNRDGLPFLSVYRVTEDRPWHQHAARNLGAHVARTPWLLMTDMDHVLPPSTMAEALRLLPELGQREVLTFGRVDAPPTLAWRAMEWPDFARTRRDDGSLKPHVNSFVTSRRHYWKAGGYDEDLCGIYGTDRDFRDRLFKRAIVRHLEHAPLIRVGRESIPDASTRGVERKVGDRAAQKKAARAGKAGDGPTVLNFPWERVI